MDILGRKGYSRAPSPYNRFVFHTIRTVQLISSILAMSFLSYFVWWLQHDEFPVPWTFILLLSVSSFTIASIFITSYFYYMRSLKPNLSVYINSFLVVLWMLGFALLSWNLSPLLTNSCDITVWRTKIEVMICQMYKGLEAFTVTGMLGTIAALALDLYTLKSVTRLGTYDDLGLKNMELKNTMRQNDSQDDFSHQMPDESYGLREPSLEIPEYSHEVKRPYKPQRPIEVNSFGYQAPTEQTAYDSPSVEKDDFTYDSGA